MKIFFLLQPRPPTADTFIIFAAVEVAHLRQDHAYGWCFVCDTGKLRQQQ